MSLIRYENPALSLWPTFGRWTNLREELDSLFEPPFTANFDRGQLFGGWSPALDLYQNNDSLVAMVEVPGLRKENIEISLHDGTLIIAGERKQQTSGANGDKAERTERYIGKFRRSIALPARVDPDKITANYRDGILTITMPKAEEAKPKQIKISAD